MNFCILLYKTSDYIFMMSNYTPKLVMFSVDDVHLSGFHFDITQTEMPKSIDSYSFHIFSGNVTLVTWEQLL